MITIPNPCSENWSKMSKTEKGRFCNSCNKQVIDFSKMKNDKIEAYFENNKNNEICGNFKTSQVAIIDHQKSKFKLIAIFMVFISFLINGCVTRLKGKICAPESFKKDTIQSNPNRTKGPPKYIKPVKKNEIITDTIKK